jgi:hypothetical protein
MRRRYALIGMGTVAVLLLVSPALGGPSLKSLVKKEVARQLAGKTGPQGPAGTNGTNGADGTTHAYAFVDRNACDGNTPSVCDFQRSKGVTSVTKPLGPSSGVYCVTAPGLDPHAIPAVATAEIENSLPGDGTVTAVWDEAAPVCSANQYMFATYAGASLNSTTSFSFAIP